MLEQKWAVDIKIDRLLLRKFQISDAEEIFATWTSDERIAKYTSWYAYQNIEDIKVYVGYMASKNEILVEILNTSAFFALLQAVLGLG